MPALLEENESKGFVSKGIFRNLLFIGLICMMIAMLLNSLSEEPDYILGLSIAMFFYFSLSLMLINKIGLYINMRWGIVMTLIAVDFELIFDQGGVIWMPVIPLMSFALLGEREGRVWNVLAFILFALTLAYDAVSLSPIYSLVELENIALAYSAVCLITWFYVHHIEITHRIILQHISEKERLEVAQNISGGMAHLINNEMQGIIGSVGLLEMRANDKDMKNKLGTIIEMSYRASDHANQLLSYAREGICFLQPIDLLMLVEELSEMWRQQLPKYMTFELYVDSPLPECLGDAKLLRQVLNSLFENAKEACGEDGKIELSITLDDLAKDCPVRTLKPGQYIRFAMKDNGCGIDLAMLAKVFEPFFSTKFTGRGLGLAAVHGIIKKHDGHISVESSLDQGAVFTVWLPIIR